MDVGLIELLAFLKTLKFILLISVYLYFLSRFIGVLTQDDLDFDFGMVKMSCQKSSIKT